MPESNKPDRSDTSAWIDLLTYHVVMSDGARVSDDLEDAPATWAVPRLHVTS